MGRRALLAASLVIVSGAAVANDLRDENLLQSLPAGFEVGHQAKRDGLTMVERIPAGQSVNDWSEMVTTQIFHSNAESLDAFFGGLRGRWARACDDAETTLIREGEENGYPFALWLFSCPLNPSTGKPEMTWMKGVRGNDALYVVQWAFRTEPSEDDIRRSVGYLRSVVVCDSRLPHASCPSIEPAAAVSGDDR